MNEVTAITSSVELSPDEVREELEFRELKGEFSILHFVTNSDPQMHHYEVYHRFPQCMEITIP